MLNLHLVTDELHNSFTTEEIINIGGEFYRTVLKGNRINIKTEKNITWNQLLQLPKNNSTIQLYDEENKQVIKYDFLELIEDLLNKSKATSYDFNNIMDLLAGIAFARCCFWDVKKENLIYGLKAVIEHGINELDISREEEITEEVLDQLISECLNEFILDYTQLTYIGNEYDLFNFFLEYEDENKQEVLNQIKEYINIKNYNENELNKSWFDCIKCLDGFYYKITE